MGLNHTYQYQSATAPNLFWFTPDQIVRCCLEHGRAKDSDRTASFSEEGLTVTLTLTKALIEKSCRTDVGSFHGGCKRGSLETYEHGDDGSLIIKIQEPMKED